MAGETAEDRRSRTSEAVANHTAKYARSASSRSHDKNHSGFAPSTPSAPAFKAIASGSALPTGTIKPRFVGYQTSFVLCRFQVPDRRRHCHRHRSGPSADHTHRAGPMASPGWDRRPGQGQRCRVGRRSCYRHRCTARSQVSSRVLLNYGQFPSAFAGPNGYVLPWNAFMRISTSPKLTTVLMFPGSTSATDRCAIVVPSTGATTCPP